MKILYLMKEIPYPFQTNGSTVINKNLLERFPADWEIDTIFFSNNNCTKPHLTKLGQFVRNYYIVPWAKKTTIVTKLLYTFILQRPYELFYFKNPHFKKTVGELIHQNQYDLIYCDGLFFAENRDEHWNRIKKVLNPHDSLIFTNERFLANAKNPFKRLYFFLRKKIFVNYEIKHFQHFDKIIFVSEPDAQFIRQYDNTLSIIVIPNGTDFKPIENIVREKHSFLYTGSMSYNPNIAAAFFFVTQVFPRIRKKLPDAKFYIAGNTPVKKIRGLACDSIIVTGFVENLAEYFSKCEVYVSPLFTGAGIKNKILEAMSCKIPVVATRISVDGIQITDQQDYMHAETADEFYTAIIKILENPELKNQLARNAYNSVMQNYTWDAIMQKYIELFHSLIIEKK